MDTPPDRSVTSNKIDEILSKAARLLGSMEAPDYSRIKVNAHRYIRLVAELSSNFWIRDVTDINTDASSVLLLRPVNVSKIEDCLLYVSNIGDYAFVTSIDQDLSDSDSSMQILVELIKRHGLEILPKDILSVPVKALTFNSEQPRLFNIIFSDTEYLPWEKADYGYDETAANDV